MISVIGMLIETVETLLLLLFQINYIYVSIKIYLKINKFQIDRKVKIDLLIRLALLRNQMKGLLFQINSK